MSSLSKPSINLLVFPNARIVLYPLILSDKKLSIGDLAVDINRTVSLRAVDILPMTKYETTIMIGINIPIHGITIMATKTAYKTFDAKAATIPI